MNVWSYMKREDFMDYLINHGIKVFNIHEAARIFGKPEKYVSIRMSQMPKINRAARGIYFIQDTDLSEVATKIISPSYLSLLSAYAFHGVTTQIPIEYQVMSPVQHKNMKINGYQIKFFKLRQDRVFGYSAASGTIVASIEKAIVDSLYFNLYTDETLDVMLNNYSEINKKRLLQYGIRMNSKATISRLGYLLETSGYDSDSLLEYRSQRYVNFGGGGESRSSKWRVNYAE